VPDRNGLAITPTARAGRADMYTPTINLCETGFFSWCRGSDNVEDQRLCGYFQKATHANRCMFLKQSFNNHCDSLKAQTRAPLFENELEINLEDFIVEDASSFENYVIEHESASLQAQINNLLSSIQTAIRHP
jgi:hypothetical protein